MSLQAVYQQLSGIPDFAGRVKIASDLESAFELANGPAPMCVLVGPAESAEASSLIVGAPRQSVDLSFGVLIVVRYAGEVSDAKGLEWVDLIRGKVHSALLGVQLSEGHDGVLYAGGRIVAADPSALFWLSEYRAVYLLEGS